MAAEADRLTAAIRLCFGVTKSISFSTVLSVQLDIVAAFIFVVLVERHKTSSVSSFSFFFFCYQFGC